MSLKEMVLAMDGEIKIHIRDALVREARELTEDEYWLAGARPEYWEAYKKGMGEKGFILGWQGKPKDAKKPGKLFWILEKKPE